jgi:hypothetical protein
MTTIQEFIEKKIGRKLTKLEPVLRTCWECNGSHKHLKKAKYVIYCFDCGKYWLKGKEIK